jgi:tRNA modification GTPase
MATLVGLSAGEISDTAIAIYFPAPHSFTGEDVVEIQCHGGALLLERFLSAICVAPECRLAQNGEFTRRALLNGKMTLAGAENLINLIHAESDAELAANGNLAAGELHDRISEIETGLTEIAAELFGALDHPDEIAAPNPRPKIKSFIKILAEFTDAAETARYVYDGIRVAILGEPNAGKSSLFNSILGSSRSIVTEIAGTTTDTVSETIEIAGFKVRLLDTAGIRENARDKIETLGIERARATAAECDVAICFDETAAKLAATKPIIRVTRTTTPATVKSEIARHLPHSKSALRRVTNARQLNELRLASAALSSAASATGTDMVASDVQTALFHLGNITGTNASETVLDEIFSRFCLGK